MTVQSESAAPPPCKRPEVRRDLPFILAANILAEGTHPYRQTTGASA